jgi:hypothetical protein
MPQMNTWYNDATTNFNTFRELPTSGKATYTNTATGAVYKLGFELASGETELSKAWDLVGMVCRRNGWRAADVKVKAGV